MTQQQEVARHIYEADGAWLRTSEIAALADMMDRAGSVSAYVSNLRTRGLIESRSTEGKALSQHRVKNREAMAKFIGIADGLDEGSFTHRKRAATSADILPSPVPLADALCAAGNGKPPPKQPESAPAKPRAATTPDESKKLDKPSAATLTYAIDHRGKLILCFGDAAFELQPPQWSGLAKFLHPLAEVFA